jgi:hypothetical protein
MNIALVRKLIEAGIIKQNTELDAYYMGVDISGRAIARTRGTFFIQSVRVQEASNTVIFETLSTVDGQKRTLKSHDVVAVDGMPLDRLGGIYGINETGGMIAQGKRRGRRPRPKVAATA